MKDRAKDDEILRLLQDSGLTENEAAVYKFLVENGGATTKDLLRKLKFRQPQIYDITAVLERKHFLNVLESRPKRYLPANMEVILDQRLKDLKDNRETLLKWSASSTGVETNQPAMWLSRNWESFINNAAEIVRKARDTLCIESTPPIIRQLQSELGEGRRKRADSVLLVYGMSRNKYMSDYLKSDKKIFDEIRYLNLGQFFAVIGDAGGAAFMPRTISFKNAAERYGYVFRDSDVAWFLTHNFFNGWFKSERLYARPLELPKRHTMQRLAVSDMIQLRREDRSKRLNVTVEGTSRKDGEKINVTGTVTDIIAAEDIVNFTVVSDGREYVVGGYDAIVEDVEADWIEVNSFS